MPKRVCFHLLKIRDIIVIVIMETLKITEFSFLGRGDCCTKITFGLLKVTGFGVLDVAVPRCCVG